MPERKDQERKRAGRPGRKPGLDGELYAARDVAERCANKLERWRAIATRYDKRAANYRAAIVVASLVVRLTSRFTRHALGVETSNPPLDA